MPGIASAAACLLLTACTASRTQTGAALAPGESATLHLFGPDARFELHNIGKQPVEYSVFDRGIASAGRLSAGGRIVESRDHGDLTLTIINPGPNPAQAMIESRSAGGMEFNQPGN